LIGMVLIYFIHKNNNQNVFKVEESIFLNYDWINQLSIEHKKIIFGEVKVFYKTKGKNIKKLTSLLTKPETPTNLPSESPNDKSHTTKRSRWLCQGWNDG